MTAITTILSVFLSMAMVAMANSVATVLRNNAETHQLLFVAFFILLRLKLYLDDLDYCKSADRKSYKFKLEFSAGMIFWFLWISAAAILPAYYILACILLSCTILFGTLILFISDHPKKRSLIIFNILYILLLICSALLSRSWEALSAIAIFGASLLVFWDFKKNTSFDIFERP